MRMKTTHFRFQMGDSTHPGVVRQTGFGDFSLVLFDGELAFFLHLSCFDAIAVTVDCEHPARVDTFPDRPWDGEHASSKVLEWWMDICQCYNLNLPVGDFQRALRLSSGSRPTRLSSGSRPTRLK